MGFSRNPGRSRSILFVAALVLLGAYGHAAEGGYVKKWYWDRKEERKLKDLEEKVEAFEVEKREGFEPTKGFRLETDDWIVITEVDARYTAETALFMEIFSDVFRDVFDFETGKEVKQKVTVLVFEDPEGYARARGMPGSRGVFMHRVNPVVQKREYMKKWREKMKKKGVKVKEEDMKPADEKEADEYDVWHLMTYVRNRQQRMFKFAYHPVIQHEGTHAMLQRKMGRTDVPNWLNEGFATFYEYWDLRSGAKPTGRKRKDKKARLARATLSPTKHELREYVRANKGFYPKLGYMVKLNTSREWNVDGMGPQTRLHYALAESFADYMISSKDGRKLLKKIMERIVKGESPVITEEEVDEHQEDWWKHLRKVWGINGKTPKD